MDATMGRVGLSAKSLFSHIEDRRRHFACARLSPT